jgi:diketogulonate reductase-like aldo/keto reductase
MKPVSYKNAYGIDRERHFSDARMTRAAFLRLAGAGALTLGFGIPAFGNAAVVKSSAGKEERMHRRPIPSTGELLPVIGCGTWQTFDVGTSSEERAPLAEVLRTLFDAGGSVIDSSPMYGRSETVVGDLLTQQKAHHKAFVATKVWTQGRDAGIKQMQRSMQLLQDERIELMQIHNLLDWRTHLATLRAWKKEGRIRYLGITHYTPSAYNELESIMRSEKLDFIQINYSLADRQAERTLLPLAAERGIAVLVNRPFGGGSLLRNLAGTPLPPWAGEIECVSWAQVLLKYVVSHPSITCAIPGTSRPQHMADNCRAGMGIIPDEAMRKRMVASWERR